MRKRFIFVV